MSKFPQVCPISQESQNGLNPNAAPLFPKTENLVCPVTGEGNSQGEAQTPPRVNPPPFPTLAIPVYYGGEADRPTSSNVPPPGLESQDDEIMEEWDS